MFFYFVVSFILGCAIGSFLNVVIDRVTRGESILGRSKCDWCRAKLETVDLVPIISFVGLGAKCRHCGRKISIQYPLVEAACGFLFALASYILILNGNLSINLLLFWFYLISTLIVVAVVDIKYSLIPTTFVFAASLVSLFFLYFNQSSNLFIEHVFAGFGAGLFFLLIVLLTMGRGMGQGDIIVGFLMGLVLGVKGGVLSIFLAFFLGALVSIILIIIKKKRFGQTVPFAPFLVTGFLIALFFQNEIWNIYLKFLL